MRKGSHLKEGLGTRSSGLEHDGEDGEDDDLDGGAARVPVGTADSILQERRSLLVWKCHKTKSAQTKKCVFYVYRVGALLRPDIDG